MFNQEDDAIQTPDKNLTSLIDSMRRDAPNLYTIVMETIIQVYDLIEN